MVPLRRKLVSLNLLTLLTAILAFGWTTSYGLRELSNQFLNSEVERTEKVRDSYQAATDQMVKTIQEIYEKALHDKGDYLLSNNSAFLAPMIADNSFVGVKQILQKTFEIDANIVLATYFQLDHGEIKAWHLVSTDHPKGLPIPIVYNRKLKAWEASGNNGKKIVVHDPHVEEIVALNHRQFTVRKEEKGRGWSGYEFVQPMAAGGLSIWKARSAGEPVGFLRYILSPSEMNHTIANQKIVVDRRLEALEKQNQESLTLSENLSMAKSQRVIFILGGAAILIILVGCVVSFVAAGQVARPVRYLTQIAKKMAEGDYLQEVNVKTNDEIGIFAETFEKMKSAIRKRDLDLAEINRNLEKTVDLRTLQLKEENRKISSLLNNLKQAVFAVSSDLTVVAPVSKFSETVFQERLEGKSVYDFIFKDIDRKSEEWSSLQSALTCVFGEEELQWELMRQNLPTRIEGRKILRVNYSPLYDDAGRVEQILMVVEDISDLERLEKEVQAQRFESERIQEVLRNDLELTKNFLSTTSSMILEAQEVLDRDGIAAPELLLVLRHLHTIKGNAGTLEFSKIAQLSHRIESDAESLKKKVLSATGDVRLSTDQLLGLRAGLVSLRDQLSDYLDTASKLLGIKNELKLKSQYDLHFKFVHLGWSQGQPSELLEGVRTVFNFGLFPLYSRFHPIWIELGLKLWEVSRFLGDRSPNQGVLQGLKGLEQGFHTQGLVFYEAYVQEIMASLSGGQWDRVSFLHRQLWVQYFNTVQIFTAAIRDERDRGLLRTRLSSILQIQPVPRDSGTSFKGNWLDSLVRLFERKGVQTGAFFDMWVSMVEKDRTGFLEALFERKAGVLNPLEPMSIALEQLTGSLSGWEARGSNESNEYLRRLDLCLVMGGTIEDPELIKARDRMIEVPEQNFFILREAIESSFNENLTPEKGPIRQALAKFFNSPLKESLWTHRKLIESVSKRLGKKVQFRVFGDDVSLPFETLQPLMDAIAHLLRNSLVHGIESAEQRKKRGKTEVAEISVEVRDREEVVELSVRDDGAGIDPQFIANQAVLKGLITKEAADKLGEVEKMELIFRVGFSTQSESDDLAGRGVGLDVVRTNVTRLGGRLTLASVLGQETTFTLIVPSSFG